MPRRVGIYARTSRAEQDDPTSIPVQLADCRERAEGEGWKVVAEYTDPGISGWKRKHRPDYERLVADAEAGRIDAVLCREYERLLRNDKEGARWLDLFETRGFHDFRFTLEGDIDLRRARDRKDWKERVAGAVYYSDRLSERVRRTKAKRKADGVFGGGGPAFGYNFTEDGPVINPEEASLIHDAVKQLGRGDSLYRLTMVWNDAGVTTANGKRWQPSGVKRLLTGEHVTGGNGFPAVLTDIEAAIVRQKLPPAGKTGRPPGRRFAATALLFCAECGTKMTTGPGRYRCSVSHGGCGRVSIEATRLERYLIEQSMKHLTRSGPDDKHETAPDTAPILSELREVEQQLSDITEALGDGSLTVSVAGPAAKALEDRRRALTEALARALPPAQTGKGLYVVELPEGVFVTDEEKFFGPHSAAAFMKRWEQRKLTGNEIENLRDTIAARVERAEVRRGRLPVAERVSVTWR